MQNLIANHAPFQSAVAALGFDFYSDDLLQTAVELATVVGHGIHVNMGGDQLSNADYGNYMVVVYWQATPDQPWLPYLLVLVMDSHGPVSAAVSCPLDSAPPVPTLDQLAATGLWPCAAPA